MVKLTKEQWLDVGFYFNLTMGVVVMLIVHNWLAAMWVVMTAMWYHLAMSWKKSSKRWQNLFELYRDAYNTQQAAALKEKSCSPTIQ